MDPTAQFFSKLKKLAVTLESETDKLQQTFENRNDDDDDDDDSENTAKAMRAYHELNGEVGSLKGQVQDQLAQQKARESEVSGFINACRVMQQKVTKDIRTLRGHWEKYGYRAPRDAQRPTKNKGQESDDEAADENESKSEEVEEDGSQEEAGDDSASSPVALPPPPVIDALRTPQLSDFGLSEMQLKRTLAGAEWCAEVPPMPEMSLPHPALNTPAPPPMPLTPKCALRMSDEELLTPQMHDFGITEHTMCLNNDFTMDLLRKNIEKPRRPSRDEPVPPAESLKESSYKKAAAADLESPEPPVFCTPGFKIKKTNSHRGGGGGPPEPGSGDPESPGLHLHTTPEAPTFQTPYVNRLVSSKKGAKLQEPVDMQDDDDDDDSGHALKLPTLARNAAAGSKRTWEYDVPEISFTSAEDKPMPEMPNLESVLGNSLQNRSAKMPKKTSAHEKVTKGPTVHSLELDGPTQEFSLGTPRIRMDYQEPTTPEMPDLSSVTQDICKLVSQAQLKKTEVAVVQPNVRSKTNRNSSVSLSVVSEGEFQSLPSYLRQMTLSNLNQAVHSINQFTADFEGEKTELQMEELRRITKVGTKTPVFILCLTELKRLEHVRGARNTSVYKLSTR